MELVESNFELLICGAPCSYVHPPPPLWTGKSINPKCILHTLVRIMKDPISEDQMKRQLYLLDDLQQGLYMGFWIEDIENCTKLIEILLCKGEVLPVFDEYAKYLLCLMRYPPLMCRTNQILDYDRDVQGYFDFFGYILVTTSKCTVRDIVIECLKDVVEYTKTIKCHSMPREMMMQQIQLSNLPAILASYMELCTNEYYFALVPIVAEISTYSTAMCMALIRGGCLHTVMMRLDPNWQDHLGGPRPEFDAALTMDASYPLDDAIMLIHTLLDAYHQHPDDAHKRDITAPTVEALWGLRYALRVYTLVERHRSERNFVGALCLLFAQCFPDGKHVQSGIVHDVSLLATLGDITMAGKWAAPVHFDSDDASDCEFKKTMMIGLITYCDCLGADRIYLDADVMVAMCKLLDSKSSRLAEYVRESLLLTTLHVLQHIVPKNICAFLHFNGLPRIENILMELITNKDQEERYDIYYQTLKLTHNIIELNSTLRCKFLSEEYLRQQSVLQRDIINRMFNMPLKLKNQKLMTQSLLILAILPKYECALDVEFTIALLKRVLKPRHTDLAYIQRLFVAAITLVWKHGMHNDANYFYFIELKGVYLLLDLMKDADFAVQLVCLGYLVDLIEEGTAIPYVVTWEKNGVGIQALLLNIFHNECVKTGVALLPRGVIADAKYPLMGKRQKELFTTQAFPSSQSLCLTDVYLSCRPRVYAIMQLLSETHGETLELLNDYYRTYNANLTTEHKITKLLCDNYLVLKLGEMWMEFDLYISPIDPVPRHRFVLDTLRKHFLECGAHVQRMQNNWLAIERKNEHISEEEFYNLLRETKLAPAIRALAEMQFLAKAARDKMKRASYSTITPGGEEKVIIETHRTMPEIKTFPVPKQKLIIQSDIIVDPFAPIPPKPVSEDGEDDVTMYDTSASDISLPIKITCKEFKSDKKDVDNACVEVKKKAKRKKRGKSAERKRRRSRRRSPRKSPRRSPRKASSQKAKCHCD